MKIFLLLLAISLSSTYAMDTSSFVAEEEKTEADDGFYYCYIQGYFNGDPDLDGYIYSSIEEYDAKPSENCTGWKEYAEKNEKHFTAECHTYTLYGPFSFSHQALMHRNKKQDYHKNFGKISTWNKGPRKK